MTRKQELEQLLDFDAWANEKLVAAAAELSGEDFTRDLGSSFPSVRDTLVHVMSADWVWLERWMGRSPAGFPEEWKEASPDEIRRIWGEVRAKRRELLGRTSEEELDRVIEYRNLAGKEFRSPLWQILRHVVNHATYHRGQVVTMLRQLGAQAPSTDLIHYLRTGGA